MKCLIKIVSAFLLAIPTITMAGWEVAAPPSATPSEPFFQAGKQRDSAFSPNRTANFGTPAATYAISISGSLKENLERIMDRYHWKVVWKVPYDYNLDGRFTGSSLPNVIEQLLQPFPLQAVLYKSNRTMIVVPRKI